MILNTFFLWRIEILFLFWFFRRWIFLSNFISFFLLRIFSLIFSIEFWNFCLDIFWFRVIIFFFFCQFFWLTFILWMIWFLINFFFNKFFNINNIFSRWWHDIYRLLRFDFFNSRPLKNSIFIIWIQILFLIHIDFFILIIFIFRRFLLMLLMLIILRIFIILLGIFLRNILFMKILFFMVWLLGIKFLSDCFSWGFYLNIILISNVLKSL